MKQPLCALFEVPILAVYHPVLRDQLWPAKQKQQQKLTFQQENTTHQPVVEGQPFGFPNEKPSKRLQFAHWNISQRKFDELPILAMVVFQFANC
jgi:hypothetical protein